MTTTCSLEEAAQAMGMGFHQVLTIIESHPDIFKGIKPPSITPQTPVSVSCLEAFEALYEDAVSFREIANRLGVSIERIQKVRLTPGTDFLNRSFCSQKICPRSGRPSVQRNFPKKDAEAFIEYCETRGIFKFLEPCVRTKSFTYATLEKEDVISASKAYRFKDAVQDGFNPQAYKSSGILPGTYTGKLVFKVWGRKSIIQCFFILENEERIRLTAFRPHSTPWRGYTPLDGKVDFSTAGIEGTQYKITTNVTQRGVVRFLSAVVMA